MEGEMILFLISLNGKGEYLKKAQSEFKNFRSIYPNFTDGKSLTFRSNDLRNFAYILLPSQKLLGNRNYLAYDKMNLFFYNGLPIDPSKRILAHRAEEFLKRYDELKYDFEGQASLFKINKYSFDVDIITDNLGMEQVFYYNKNNEFLISNSVSLIKDIVGCTELDTFGASTFLSLGWVAEDHTLIKDIKVIKGGQHWRWDSNKKQIDKRTYFNIAEFNPKYNKNLNKKAIQELYEEFAQYLLILENNFDLECPLTGGFDSRLVATILLSKKIKAAYYTTGNPEHIDVEIATSIANKFNLPYSIYQIDYNSLFENWDCIIKRFLQQTNGLASLWGISGILTHFNQLNSTASKLTVRLATEGAESTRSTYNHPSLWQKNVNEDSVYTFIKNRCLHNYCNILSNNSLEIFKCFLDSFFKNNIESKLDYKLLPGLLYIIELVGRFHGNNRGIYKNVSDSFSPFCSKNYLATGLRMLPVDRATYPVHSKMIRMLNKDLYKLPNEHGNWPVNYPRLKIFLGNTYPVLKKYLSKYKSGDKAKVFPNGVNVNPNNKQSFDRKRIFETKLNEIKSICFDQHNSELWQLINKNALEKILCNNKIDEKAYRQLYVVATLFYNENLNKTENVL